jgi:CRP-like cAMP-binding protein
LFAGRLAFEKGGKQVDGAGTVSSGQYFGEAALCTAQPQVASFDVVAKDYSEVYVLRQQDLLDIAAAYSSDGAAGAGAGAAGGFSFFMSPLRLSELSELEHFANHLAPNRPLLSAMCVHGTLSGSLGDVLRSKK